MVRTEVIRYGTSVQFIPRVAKRSVQQARQCVHRSIRLKDKGTCVDPSTPHPGFVDEGGTVAGMILLVPVGTRVCFADVGSTVGVAVRPTVGMSEPAPLAPRVNQ